MAKTRLATLTALLICTACATGDSISLSAYPDLVVAMRELQREQERFTASTVVPRTFDFPGHGRVTVRQVELEGYPGNTYVKCRWHYINNTGRPVLRAVVGLDVLDGEGRLVASKVSVCVFPSDWPVHDGTFFSDELRTRTFDVHLQPGWSWRITCRSEYLDEDDGRPGETVK